MFKNIWTHGKNRVGLFIILITGIVFPEWGLASHTMSYRAVQDTLQFRQYSGSVVDARSGEPLVFAVLQVEGSNISSITNTEGEFLLKVPKSENATSISVYFLGYQEKQISIATLKPEKNEIELEPSAIELTEVDVSIPKDPEDLVRKVFEKRKNNYVGEGMIMTAFYRETIRKRRRNVSLSEAVVNVYKQPYANARPDQVKLFKSRKSTDYSRLDTLALKLQGGPFSTLYVDIMKYPEFIFQGELIDEYEFAFERSTTVNNQPVFVIRFNQKDWVEAPRYYGTLYINSNTQALVSAVFKLNLENLAEASRMFVKRKPSSVRVWPTEAAYRVDYRQTGGKWYYGYSNVQLAFKVNWRNKLFNSLFTLSSEMAVTDWEKNTEGLTLPVNERLRPSVVLSDEASGFSDPDFWGDYNVIEPEKSIESAINKIKRKLRKNKDTK
ncbi:carboxypeptidase-like regulatory domain-containing protein [Ascidiimonas aurantiaca]|uniref:carboxypeptidase-like regulatory domain-containing protein n=1 Tax=Ascidiimonas aurantiaca TaxID=1685432 RepID=UPI0030ECF639